jgi:hypothetical protein
LTEDEYYHQHPAQTEELVKAWENKEHRKAMRHGESMFIIAASQGVKINGRKVKLSDFTPTKSKQTPQDKEAKLKAAFMALAARKQNGKS